jgi:glycerol uptake facilitator protein
VLFLVTTHKDHFAATEDEGGKLACFLTGPAIRNYYSNLISEIIGTFVLIFVIFLAGPDVVLRWLLMLKLTRFIGALPSQYLYGLLD